MRFCAGIYCPASNFSLREGCAGEISFKDYDIRTCTKKRPEVDSTSVMAGNDTYGNNSLWCSVNCEGKRYMHGNEGESSIVGEFDLICEDYWLVSLCNTMYFAGSMVGGAVFGILADKFGRKRSIIAASTMGLAAGIAAAFAPHLILFAISRTILGICLQGGSMSAFTLMMESFPRDYRESAGVASQFVFAIGIVLLAGFAYLIPNWRYLQLFVVLTVLIAVAYIFLVHESLRWLYINYRFEHASNIVHKIMRFNGVQLTKRISDCMSYLVMWHQKDEEIDDKASHSMWNLFTSAQLRKRCLCMTFIWFTGAICYYAISFSLSDWFGSKYWNLAIGGLVDVPITLITMLLVSKYGCRVPLIYTSGLSGVLCLIAASIPLHSHAAMIAKTVFAQIARAVSHGMFNMMIPYASELFPTVVRNNGLGVCGIGMRLGGVLAPQLLLLGNYTTDYLPMITCGVMAGAAALISYLLPETKGHPMPETVEDLLLRQTSVKSKRVEDFTDD
ncbi:organic cation transporter protein-like isoform X2 [Paramacrobiotus metropolitanus]|uniref:organic cation transporter protein-like isoform X2 n=1 Tax=Paramacrobiotus metropolitanus TaxID=2943436 RepID=UPI00244588FB|nr:organic cation transporter protein-like isoform X2 [Paramacrobiotus metropolitanus]